MYVKLTEQIKMDFLRKSAFGYRFVSTILKPAGTGNKLSINFYKSALKIIIPMEYRGKSCNITLSITTDNLNQLTRYRLILLFIFLGFSQWGAGQTILSGTVFDTSKVFVVPGVEVFTTSGNQTITDTLGNYRIEVMPVDSVYFLYNNKFTQKFPIAGLRNLDGFDISLLVKTDSKYKLLNSITVFSKSYRQDSLAYRKNFSQILESGKPTLETSFEPGGAAGIGIESLIEMFQFRKNRSRLAFKDQLEKEEQDRYIDYRFSAETVSRITGLKGTSLEQYRRLYRPRYEFVSGSTLAQFYTYVLQTSYKFKKENGIQ